MENEALGGLTHSFHRLLEERYKPTLTDEIDIGLNGQGKSLHILFKMLSIRHHQAQLASLRTQLIVPPISPHFT